MIVASPRMKRRHHHKLLYVGLFLLSHLTMTIEFDNEDRGVVPQQSMTEYFPSSYRCQRFDPDVGHPALDVAVVHLTEMPMASSNEWNYDPSELMVTVHQSLLIIRVFRENVLLLSLSVSAIVVIFCSQGEVNVKKRKKILRRSRRYPKHLAAT